MKTKGILIALTVIFLTSINLFAGAENGKGLNNPDSSKLRINIRVNQDNLVVLRAACCENQKWAKLVLKVYDDNGEMVYASTIIQQGGIYKGFDMNKLPEGKYTFDVYKNLKKVYSKVIFKSSEIVSAKESNSRMIVQEI